MSLNKETQLNQKKKKKKKVKENPITKQAFRHKQREKKILFTQADLQSRRQN